MAQRTEATLVDEICNCNPVVPTKTKHYETCTVVLQEKLKNGELRRLPRDSKGHILQTNMHLKSLSNGDVLYHLALGTATHDLKTMFGDVKFVCMGGTVNRMKQFAQRVAKELHYDVGPEGPKDITLASNRYSMYKVGPVLSINHGIGSSTLNVVLQEVLKLIQYAEAVDPIFIRIGTSGGIDLTPGSVVVSNKAFNGLLENTFDLAVLGKIRKMPAILDNKLAEELQQMSRPDDGFQVVCAGTMAAEDFYQGQGRLDGPFCDYSKDEKMNFLKELRSKEIHNIEMEVCPLSALTRMAGVKAAVVCVTFLDRLNGDQVLTPKETLLEWEQRPATIVLRYIKEYLKKNGEVTPASKASNGF